jgi:hypothetical protein
MTLQSCICLSGADAVQSDMPELHTLDRADSGNVSTAWTQWQGDKYGPPPFNGALAGMHANSCIRPFLHHVLNCLQQSPLYMYMSGS